jgi:hypothetical protein
MSIKYSKGICWLDDCRIPFVETDPLQNGISGRDNGKMDSNNQGWGFKRLDREPGLGRFTPNLLVCDDMLNDGIKPNKGHRAKGKVSGYGEFGGGKSEYHGVGEYMEVDSKSRYYDLDLWFDKLIKELN